MTQITTSPFTISAASYARETILDYFTKWWWLPAIIIAGCVIASFFDLRWSFVGLILMFLVVPFALFNIYFSRLLTPDTRTALAEKQLSFIAGNRIIVSYTGEDTTLPSESISWDRIESLAPGKHYVRINFHGDTPPFILMKRDAITDSELSWLTAEILK